MRTAWMSTLALVGALLVSRGTAAQKSARIFRWQDGRGVVHYSDHRPRQIPARRIRPAPEDRNRISPLSAFERQQVQRFDQRVREHLQARRSAARAQARKRADRHRTCTAIKRKLGDLQDERRQALTLEESNRNRSSEWQLRREQIRRCH